MDTFRDSVRLIAQNFGRIRKTNIHKQITVIQNILLAAPKLKQTNKQEYDRLTETLEDLKADMYKGAKVRSNLQY